MTVNFEAMKWLEFYLDQIAREQEAGRLGAPAWAGVSSSHDDCSDQKDQTDMATKAILTPVGVATFVNLKEPRPVVAGQEPRFSLNLIFDEAAMKSAEYKALQDAIAECIADKWGKKLPANLRGPIRDGAEKAGQYAGYREGVTFINPWTKERPGVVDAQRNEIIDLTTVYAGMSARAFVRPFAYDSGSNKGVSLLLDAVQFVEDGPRLDGRKNATEMFGAFERCV